MSIHMSPDMTCTDTSAQTADDETSYLVNFSLDQTHGLCQNYTLRRHKYEAEANAGCYEARSDWIKYIGPIEQFGGCNPRNGNFTAVVLPLTKPERMRLIAYVLEYAFLYDNMVELEKPDSPHTAHNSNQECKNTNPALGKTQIQAKIMTKLASTDKACTERIKNVWAEMLSTTLRDKDRAFSSLEEYVDFRIVDTGAPFVESVLLFGLGETLTPSEDLELDPIRKPCYAALGLANDFFSFDREYAEYLDSGESQTLTNAVWLHMQWYGVDVATAKEMTKQATKRYEEEFLGMCEEYRLRKEKTKGGGEGKGKEKGKGMEENFEKVERYLRALAYQVSGNVVWSLNCPRYHERFRYDANARFEDVLTRRERADYEIRKIDDIGEKSTERTDSVFEPAHSRRSSAETFTSVSDGNSSDDDASATSSVSSYSSQPASGKPSDRRHDAQSPGPSSPLDTRHVEAPYTYITSLPSKGVRDTLIDALNIWLGVPDIAITRIKSLGSRLHSASLMLDDIEDGSTLRRGQPATHTIFGTPQTINSGCYQILQSVSEARDLGPSALDIVLEQLAELHIGQSYDLHWTRHGICPSEDEYLDMVGKKTGGLFRMLVQLMFAAGNKEVDPGLQSKVDDLINLIGIQYQIRDDFQNLQSPDYASQKGFAEDLDEGKFSFPVVHALSVRGSEEAGGIRLRELLRGRVDGKMGVEHKKLILGELEEAGSMAYTRDTLRRLQGQVQREVEGIEGGTGVENWVLRALLLRLDV